jgi:hypothetical protein
VVLDVAPKAPSQVTTLPNTVSHDSFQIVIMEPEDITIPVSNFSVKLISISNNTILQSQTVPTSFQDAQSQMLQSLQDPLSVSLIVSFSQLSPNTEYVD